MIGTELVFRFLLLIMAVCIGWGAFRAVQKRDMVALPMFAFSAIYLCYFIWLVPLIFAWYVVPVAAINILCLSYGISSTLEMFKDALLRNKLTKAMAFGYTCAIGCVLFFTFSAEKHTQEVVENGIRKQIGLYLDKTMGAKQTVGTECLGYVGYYSHRIVYDYPGLCSRKVIQYRTAHPDHRTLVGMFEGLEPDYLVLRPSERSALLMKDYEAVATFTLPEEERYKLFLPRYSYDLDFTVYKRRISDDSKPHS